MRAKIRLNGREVLIEDVKKVSGIGKFTGLMFARNANALLFEFKKGKKAIHSLFCKPFIAIWILEGRVQEYRVIDSWQFSIVPEKEFDKLIEVPINDRYKGLLEFFVERST